MSCFPQGGRAGDLFQLWLQEAQRQECKLPITGCLLASQADSLRGLGLCSAPQRGHVLAPQCGLGLALVWPFGLPGDSAAGAGLQMCLRIQGSSVGFMFLREVMGGRGHCHCITALRSQAAQCPNKAL